MVGVFTILGASFVAMLASVLIGQLLSLFTSSSIVQVLKTFAVSGGIGFYVTGGLTPAFFAILLSPIWFTIGFVALLMLIAIPLAVKGYLGNRYKWRWKLEGDDEAKAALNLLTDDEINEVASISADVDDYKTNLIERAGIENR